MKPDSDSIQKEPTLKEKAATGLLWGGISNFVQQLVGMAFGIFIARILLPDDFGLIAMLAIFTAMGTTIMDSGFTTALINKKEINHNDYNAVFWFGLFIGIAIYIILFFAAPLIARYYNQPVLIDLSRILFLIFIFSGAGIAQNAFLLKKIMAKQRGIIDIGAVLFSGIIGLILALNGFAFWGLALQQVSFVIVTVLLRWLFCPWRPTFRIDFSPLKTMFRFGFNLLVVNIFVQFVQNLISTILGKSYGKEITGYYAQGQKWGIIGGYVIVATINNIAQPVLVEAQSDIQRQLKIFRKMIRFGAFISIPTLLGFAFVSREFILITIGEKWLNSVIYMQLFCLWGIVSYINSLYYTLLLSHGKSTIYMRMMIAVFSIQIIALIICSSYSILLMISVYVGIYLLSVIGWQYFANKLIGIRLKDVIKDVSPYIIASIISMAIAWAISKSVDNLYLKFSVKVLVTVCVYSAILWYSNSVIFKESIGYLKKGKVIQNSL